MKKVVSVMTLCVVLFGAVMMVTGCGSKPKAGSVWKVTGGLSNDVLAAIGGDSTGVYLCFHTNRKAYFAAKVGSRITVFGGGQDYTIEKENIMIGKTTVSYNLDGEKMTVKGYKLKLSLIEVTLNLNLEKVSSPTEAEIANAAKK